MKLSTCAAVAKKMPKVELHSYGQAPEIWWEDEQGNVVESPKLDMALDDVKIT